jgi:hypothetical protein
VVYAVVHIILDYNRFAGLDKSAYSYTKDTSHKLRNTNQFLKAGAWVLAVLGFTSLLFLGSFWNPVLAQQLNTATPTPTVAGSASGAYITVTYPEGTNVRTGPSSFDYPTVGHIPVGGTAPATGRSPAGEWIQIEYADAPRGKGWVYAAHVSLSTESLLPIVEPPPTPAPQETPTLNPTFVAAFQVLPTSTRLPTFTVPPPLEIPTYTNPANSSSSRVTTTVIIILGLIGLAGILITSIRRR